MTTIGPNPYASAYNTVANAMAPPPQAKTAADTTQATATDSGSPAVTVTLSAAAKAALASSSQTDDLTAAARDTLNQLLAAAGATDALDDDGDPTIDMNTLDRRSLYAVASNSGGVFTADEQTLASDTLGANFQAAIAGPLAASRVTGDYAAIYKAGMDQMDQAGPEEKASADWIQQRTALSQGYQQATQTPGVIPKGVANDPIATELKALDSADPTTGPRPILDVASDVRTALDEQYAAATAPNAATDPNSGNIDFSAFDDRSLAAIALNKGNTFSTHEIRSAQTEIRNRNSSSVMASMGSSDGSASLGGDLLTRYANMSDEERQAEGWTPELYAKLVQNSRDSQTLAGMSTGASGGDPLLDIFSGSSDATSASTTSATGLLDQMS